MYLESNNLFDYRFNCKIIRQISFKKTYLILNNEKSTIFSL